jgi:p-cumate 2,3-dioxygenase beta subunit
VASSKITRAEVEDFLYRDAQLLDEWRLDDWLATFVEGAKFEVPTTDWQGQDTASAGYFVADDWDLIKARVQRLKSRKAHAENPHSRTNRLVGNVQVFDREDGALQVMANFQISRYRDGGSFTYIGRYDHVLELHDGDLKFRLRRSVLTNEAMDPGARLSFIV